MARNRITPAQYFWQRVAPITRATDCWLWTGETSGPMHHARMSLKSIARPGAHRFVWKLANGAIPDGLFVLHKCDNPICVNPHHLFLGTQADNMTDKTQKGRQAKGATHGMTKLAEAQVRDILASEEPLLHLAKRYGMAFNAIWSIKNGLTWKHVSNRPSLL